MILHETRFRLFVGDIQALEEIVIGTSVYLLKLDQNTYADVQFPRLVFGVTAAGNITSPQLKLGAKLFLGYTVLVAECPEIVPDTAITAEFLFHDKISFLIDQYRLQFSLLYAIMSKSIVRNAGQFARKEVKT